MGKRQTFAIVAVVVAAISGFAAPAGAKSAHSHAESASGTVSVVADHLNNPRQIAVHGGALYVAEAGTGGDICPPGTGGACLGFTGSVTRVRHGDASRVQTGLLSVNSPEGDVVGVDGLAFKGSKLYGVATGACLDPTTLPADVAAQLGKVLRLSGGDHVSAVGDPGSFECANDPEASCCDLNRPTGASGVSMPPFPLQNRPTFQQTIEVTKKLPR